MDEITIDPGRSGEPGKVSGLEPIILIGPPSPILHDDHRASRDGRDELSHTVANDTHRHDAAEAATALSGGYAPAVNHKGVGAVFAAASQVSVRPL